MDIFEGTPKDKFFDIIFNANRNLVEKELEDLAKKFVVLNQIYEKNTNNFFSIDSYMLENSTEIENELNDFFIKFTSNILTNNE